MKKMFELMLKDHQEEQDLLLNRGVSLTTPDEPRYYSFPVETMQELEDLDRNIDSPRLRAEVCKVLRSCQSDLKKTGSKKSPKTESKQSGTPGSTDKKGSSKTQFVDKVLCHFIHVYILDRCSWSGKAKNEATVGKKEFRTMNICRMLTEAALSEWDVTGLTNADVPALNNTIQKCLQNIYKKCKDLDRNYVPWSTRLLSEVCMKKISTVSNLKSTFSNMILIGNLLVGCVRKT